MVRVAIALRRGLKRFLSEGASRFLGLALVLAWSSTARSQIEKPRIGIEPDPSGDAIWISNSSGIWEDGSNWSTGGPPLPGQTVIIDRSSADVTVTLSSGTAEPGKILCTETIELAGGELEVKKSVSTIRNLCVSQGTLLVDKKLDVEYFTQSGGVVTGGNRLLVTVQANWTGGEQTGNGRTNIGESATLQMSSSSAKNLTGGRTMNNRGSTTLTDTGSLFISEGATFNNLAGASFDVQSDAAFEHFTGVPGEFNNEGNFVKSSGTNTSFDVNLAFNNDGTVQVQSGTLQLIGGGTSSGMFSISSSSSVDFASGTSILDTGASVSGDGEALLSGGTLDVAGNPVTFESFSQSTGTVTGNGELLISNRMNWTGGMQNGSGKTTIGSDADLFVSGSSPKVLRGGRTMDNSGTTTLSDSGSLFIDDGAVFNNLAGATFDIQGDADLEFFTGAPSTFDNRGSLVKSAGADTTNVDAGLRFNNDGTVQVQSGSFRFTGGGASTGSFTSDTGTAIEFASANPTYVFNPSTTCNGDGEYRVNSGTLEVSSGVDLLITQLILEAGNLADDGSTVVDTFRQSSGKLQGDGNLIVNDSMEWTGGEQAGPGTTSISGGATLTIRGTGAKNLTSGRTINHGGSATLTDSGDLFISSGAVFNNLAGASFDVQSDASFEHFTGAPGAFNNAGTFVKSAGAGTNSFDVNLTFNNDGTVQVQTGSLQIRGGGSNSGSFALDSGTAMEFAAGTSTLTNGSSISGDGNGRLIGGTLDVTGTPVDVENFEQSLGTLSGAGELRVTSSMNWTGGTQSGPGTTTVPAGSAATLGGSGSKILRGGRTFNNSATVAVPGDGSLFIDNGAVFNNLAGATFDVQTDADLEFFTGTPSTFNNDGTVRKSGGTDVTEVDASLVFNSDGNLEIQSGTFRLRGGGINTGGVDVSSGAAIEFNSVNPVATLQPGTSASGLGDWRTIGGTFEIEAGVNLTVEGFQVVGGETDIDGIVITNTLTQSGGSILGTGEISAQNSVIWNGGFMLEVGTTTIPSSGNLSIGGSQNKVMTGRTLNNSGASTMTGSGDLFLNNGSVFNNLAGATFDVQSDADFGFASGSSSTFNNSGTFLRSVDSGDTVFPSNVVFRNDGDVEVQTGTLVLQGGYTQTAGTTFLNGGNFDVGSFVLDIQSGTLRGAGVVTGSGDVEGTTDIGLSPGTLEFTGDYSQSSSAQMEVEIGGLTAGTDFDVLVVGGTVTLDGTLNVTLINGFSPQLGDSFEIMTYGSRSGDFSTYNGLVLGGGLELQASFGASSLTLTVVQP